MENSGMRISTNGPYISHLLFADNSLIFCQASLNQVSNIKRILDLYGRSSGQVVNLEKSLVIFNKNTAQEIRDDVCRELEGVNEQKKGKYLGLPLMIGRSKNEVFCFIIEAVKKKVTNWKNKFLSKAGKELLVKSVINALMIYALSYYKLLDNICKEITNISSNF